jgi:ribose/xylose/arabinose/galactoside ABC-type transport system permease subunit
LLGIPIPFIIALFMCLVIHYILNYTVFGSRIYAVGGNSNISELFGIKADRIKIAAFVMSGITAAISGVIITAKMKTGAPIAALGQELPVITAVILGGTSISGGIGNIWGTVLGVAFLSVLSNGFTLTYVSSYWQRVVRGIVLIGAVSIDIIRREKR